MGVRGLQRVCPHPGRWTFLWNSTAKETIEVRLVHAVLYPPPISSPFCTNRDPHGTALLSSPYFVSKDPPIFARKAWRRRKKKHMGEARRHRIIISLLSFPSVSRPPPCRSLPSAAALSLISLAHGLRSWRGKTKVQRFILFLFAKPRGAFLWWRGGKNNKVEKTQLASPSNLS